MVVLFANFFGLLNVLPSVQLFLWYEVRCIVMLSFFNRWVGF